MKEYFLFNSTLILDQGLAFVDEHGYDIAAWVFFAIFFGLGLLATLCRILRLFKLDQPGGLCFVFGPFLLGCSFLWFAEKEMVMQITDHSQVNMVFPAELLLMWYLSVVWTGVMSHKPNKRSKIDYGGILLLKLCCVVLYIGALCQTVGKYGNYAVCMLIVACCLCKLYATTSRTHIATAIDRLVSSAAAGTNILGNGAPLKHDQSIIITPDERESIKWWGITAACLTFFYMFVLLLSHAYTAQLSPAGLVIFSGILFGVSYIYMLFVFAVHTQVNEFIDADGQRTSVPD